MSKAEDKQVVASMAILLLDEYGFTESVAVGHQRGDT